MEKLIVGLDGYVRAADDRTASGRTNRPIARLIPLEVNENKAQEEQVVISTDVIDVSNSSDRPAERPTRHATIRARNRLKQWAGLIRAAPEDVMD